MTDFTSNKKKRRGRAPLPFSSYGPQWRLLWLKAATQDIHLRFDSIRDRNAFRLRATQYRHAAKLENFEGWEALYHAECHTPEEKTSATLVFRRKEDRFASTFAAAGIVDENRPDTINVDPLDDLIKGHGGRYTLTDTKQ
jgi:hypothetical protein